MRLRTSDIATVTGGELVGPDVTVEGATIDSRAVRAGHLFVPIVAGRDGHDYVGAALAAGAAAYLASDREIVAAHDSTAIVVPDTLRGLQDTGHLARAGLTGPVVGITGSVGKTSVKDLLAGVLAQRFRTAASQRSFNNEMGVPLTLLAAPEGTEVVVVEMGARDVGHIAELCAIAEPTVGVVTRVAAVHTEVFGTIDDVARAKSELVRDLPATGTAVLNASDERVAAMASVTPASVLTFGASGEVRAEEVELDHELRARFRLCSPWGDVPVAMASRGVHQVDNALAAAAAALTCGASLEDVAAGLAEALLSPWRMELATAPDGALVLNDAYNANPTSVAAALESLVALPAERRIAVLGVMAELGPTSDAHHAEIGALAARLGVRLIAVDAPAYGGEQVASVEEAMDLLEPLGPGDAVLVKGSRVAELERLAELLLEE
ncbi:MAG TPA: UDP-N-acetylmuramoyl-tripeptide--D-alanyl-D-alanine ligase [Acidimicrobiales bacterium]|jgi:UDP-N-acetylmuramoyl-tripeptide--D-alanyl-D-alanine ligase|nr:UDP-N-acetylmuramoyl-tripeptide--D-alanyl-D-alanine ligase [Acidimicrobiales bacterium]